MNAASIFTQNIVEFIIFKSVWSLINLKHRGGSPSVLFGYIFGLALFNNAGIISAHPGGLLGPLCDTIRLISLGALGADARWTG